MDLWLEQKEVTEIIEVNKCTIANWEKNRNTPRIRPLPKIIEFLGYQPCDKVCETLSERIIKARQKLGLSQKKLACKIGIDPCTIRSWEKSKHKPSKSLLSILEEFFAHTRLFQPKRIL
jgi:transcriptional regulator with XRE-family HTH domain